MHICAVTVHRFMVPLRHIDYVKVLKAVNLRIRPYQDSRARLRGKILAVRDMFERRSLLSNCLTENSHLEVPLSLNQAAGIPIILSSSPWNGC
jgi:hypothetical protein